MHDAQDYYCCVCSPAAFIAGVIWPFTALYDIATKAEAGDAAGVSERIDFASVRRSLTRQIIDAYIRLSGIKSVRAGSLPPLQVRWPIPSSRN